MKSWHMDPLSDKVWANSRAKKLEQAAFDAWTGKGRIYKKGVWYEREDVNKMIECTVDDFIR